MTFRQNMRSSAETLKAYFRQGLRELSQVFFHGTAAQAPEYGMWNTKVQSDIAKGLSGREPAMTMDTTVQESPLNRYKAEPEQSTPAQDRETQSRYREPERDPREHERDAMTHELD